MSSGLMLPNGADVVRQRREVIIQNIASMAANIYSQLALEQYREAVAELKARKEAWRNTMAANKGPEPTNLVIDPHGISSVALAYAKHMAGQVLPEALGWIEVPKVEA